MNKLEQFRKQYPNVTSADLQTFVLGMQARDEEIQSLMTVLANTIELIEDEDRKIWADNDLRNHINKFAIK